MAIDFMRKSGREIEDKRIARINPTPIGDINFQGLFRFGIERYRENLIAPSAPGAKRKLQAVR